MVAIIEILDPLKTSNFSAKLKLPQRQSNPKKKIGLPAHFDPRNFPAVSFALCLRVFVVKIFAWSNPIQS